MGYDQGFDDDAESIDTTATRLSELANSRNRRSKKGKTSLKANEKLEEITPEETLQERFEAKNSTDESCSEFNFEIIKHYPPTRSFLIKKPLKKSFMDSMLDLLGKQ